MDETDFACSEKKRILLKLKPPGSEKAILDNFVPIFRRNEYKIATDYIEKLQAKEKQRKEEIRRQYEAEEKELREPKNDF